MAIFCIIHAGAVVMFSGESCPVCKELETLNTSIEDLKSKDFSKFQVSSRLELNNSEDLCNALHELESYRDVVGDPSELEDRLKLLEKYENQCSADELEDKMSALEDYESLGDPEEVKDKCEKYDEIEDNLSQALSYIQKGMELMPELGN